MVLAQDEGQPMRLFSLSAQIQRERAGYCAILEHTQRGGLDFTEWLLWFLAQVEAAATAAEQTVRDSVAVIGLGGVSMVAQRSARLRGYLEENG